MPNISNNGKVLSRISKAVPMLIRKIFGTTGGKSGISRMKGHSEEP
jgi:hypothetical protein